jgi:hypothetical protein
MASLQRDAKNALDAACCAALVSRFWKGTRSAGCLFVWGKKRAADA